VLLEDIHVEKLAWGKSWRTRAEGLRSTVGMPPVGEVEEATGV
jgi:hypothetical protein